MLSALRRPLAAGLALAIAGSLGPALAASGPSAAPGDLQRVVVSVSGQVADVERAVVSAGGRITSQLPIIDGFAASVPSDVVGDIRQRTDVRTVTADERVHVATTTATDTTTATAARKPGTTAPKSVFAQEIGADRLWKSRVNGRGIRVAVVDTGIAPVRDLSDRLVKVTDPYGSGQTVDCANFSGEPTCADSYGHGTFVSGLIAGTGAASNGTYKGVAPGAQLVSVKVAGRDGSADVSKVLAAIQWVVSFRNTYGIRVMNLSLGTDSPISSQLAPLNRAVERAWQSGIAVIVSASNRGPAPSTISKPADDPFVVTVGAVDDRESPGIADDSLPAFSGRGPTTEGLTKPDVVAPGGRVISLRSPNSYVEQVAPGGIDANYRRGSGTSMSTGIVSGLAALMLQANPTWTPDRLKYALQHTARPVASDSVNDVGFGIVDGYAATYNAPEGLANQGIVPSAGSSLLQDDRGTVLVTLGPCLTCVLEGETTAQNLPWNGVEYFSTDWTGSSWYGSQWTGSSWYGSSWYGSSWYGSSWYGSSWYGVPYAESYGTPVAGSSWYGAWQ